MLAVLSLFHVTKARVYGKAHFTGYVPRKRSIDQFGWFHHGLKNLIEGYNQFVQHPHQMSEFEI